VIHFGFKPNSGCAPILSIPLTQVSHIPTVHHRPQRTHPELPGTREKFRTIQGISDRFQDFRALDK
jgi:hypothetical protein